jgi:hypothetical protein
MKFGRDEITLQSGQCQEVKFHFLRFPLLDCSFCPNYRSCRQFQLQHRVDFPGINYSKLSKFKKNDPEIIRQNLSNVGFL